MHNRLSKTLGCIVLLSLLISLFPPQPVQAAMEIATDTTWSGTVPIDRDVVVRNGAVLTVESGAAIQMAGTDAEHDAVSGTDPNRIEIIIEDGALMADGAEFSVWGGGSWYGIRILPGGSGQIANCTILEGVIGIEVDTAHSVTISDNDIHTLQAGAGNSAFGIRVIEGSPTISGNAIHDIQGRSGSDGGPNEAGENGGTGYGIAIIDGAPVIEDNQIYQIKGGDGGDGGDGTDGASGNNGTSLHPEGYNGDLGDNGGEGGFGGSAYGIWLGADADGTEVSGNQVYQIIGKHGGHGGAGGDGGAGGRGLNGDPGAVGGDGAAGGVGGNGGNGGLGGAGGSAGGIFAMAVNLILEDNLVENISGGMSGDGGQGGDGGSGGLGGQGGDATALTGGSGGAGGWGGNGGSGNFAGGGGNAYGISISLNGHFSVLSGNQVTAIFGGTPGAGGGGGMGGTGGQGGDGGRGRDSGNGGNGGNGGPGGFAGLGVQGSSSGLGRALFVYNPATDPGPIVNNIFANVNTYRGGAGGAGGDGGDGGDGGTGGDGGLGGGSPGTDGAGGNGGDGNNGGDGALSRPAHLALLSTVTVQFTNNTLYLPSAYPAGGAGGTQGAPGEGGAGATPGDDGNPGSPGGAGGAGLAFGLEAMSGAVGAYNNIFLSDGDANSYGLSESASPTITSDYNILHNWGVPYHLMSGGAQDLAKDPLLRDVANGDFKLQESSPCVDAGNNAAPGTPPDDFEDVARPVDGDGNGTATVDMGAHEYRYENTAPAFTSTPVTAAATGAAYAYVITTDDSNLGEGDALTITAPTKPDWLSLHDNGDGTATLSGTPGSDDGGDHAVVLQVTDLDNASDTQAFTITVDCLVHLPQVLR